MAFLSGQLCWSEGLASELLSSKEMTHSCQVKVDSQKIKPLPWVTLELPLFYVSRGAEGGSRSLWKQCFSLLNTGLLWERRFRDGRSGARACGSAFLTSCRGASAAVTLYHIWRGEAVGKVCVSAGSDSGWHCCTTTGKSE